MDTASSPGSDRVTGRVSYGRAVRLSPIVGWSVQSAYEFLDTLTDMVNSLEDVVTRVVLYVIHGDGGDRAGQLLRFACDDLIDIINELSMLEHTLDAVAYQSKQVAKRKLKSD